jgi:hypothetical protein
MSRKAYPKADTLSRKRRAGDRFVATKCWTGVTGSREAGSARHARAEALPRPRCRPRFCRQPKSLVLPLHHSPQTVAEFLDLGPSHCCSPVARWSQRSTFFWTMNTGTTYIVSPACSGATMWTNYIGCRPTYGAQDDSENCTRCDEKRGADLSTSTPTWRCCNRPGARDGVFFPWCVGR